MEASQLTSNGSTGSFLYSAAPIAGAAVDAIGSVAGGLFAANQARKNRAFQERMYNRQLEDNRENWRMVNEYNLPKNALARIVDAGLNPLLYYQGGANGGSAVATPQGASAPHGDSAKMGFSTAFGQAMSQAALINAQVRNLDASSRQMETQADKNESETTRQDLYNWLFDKTKNVEIALKYGQYDYVKQMIAESCNRVYQSSFVNANEMASLSLQNNLAIRKQNLNEYEVGQNVMQGWQNVMNGRIMANASLKSAFAQVMNATTAARLSYAQIGLMRAQAANYDEMTRFMKDSRSYRVGQEYYKQQLLRNDLSWSDILYESGVSEQQSRIFLNEITKQKTFQDMEYKPIDELMSPINMLTGFGAGYIIKNGVTPRAKVSGFK